MSFVTANHNANGAADSAVAAFMLILSAESCLVLMAHFVKHLSLTFDTATLFLIVNFVSVCLLLPFVAYRGLNRLWSPRWGWHILRCLCGVGAMYLMYFAYARIDLSVATLLKLLSPAFIPFVAILVLRERPTLYTFVGLALALLGVYLVVKPSSDGVDLDMLGIGAGVLSAVLAAFGKSLVRKIGRSEPVDVIAFYFAVFGFLISVALVDWEVLQSQSTELREKVGIWWHYLLIASVLVTLGQYLASRAYTKTRAAVVGLFTYLALPLAGVIGYLQWGETIDSTFIGASLLILLAGFIGAQNRRITTRRNAV